MVTTTMIDNRIQILDKGENDYFRAGSAANWAKVQAKAEAKRLVEEEAARKAAEEEERLFLANLKYDDDGGEEKEAGQETEQVRAPQLITFETRAQVLTDATRWPSRATPLPRLRLHFDSSQTRMGVWDAFVDVSALSSSRCCLSTLQCLHSLDVTSRTQGLLVGRMKAKVFSIIVCFCALSCLVSS